MPARLLPAVARRLVTGGLVAAMAATLCAIPSAAVPGAAPASAATKIEPAAAAALDGDATTTFWVALDSQADLPDAEGTAEEVYEAKTRHAEQVQAGLRELLTNRGADFTTYWMDNSVRVTGDADLAEELASRPEVARIEADEKVELPPAPAPSDGVTTAIADWNMHAINAPRVWSELGVRGEGVVVASIDTGVRYDHPA